jgi:hypothetical protein
MAIERGHLQPLQIQREREKCKPPKKEAEIHVCRNIRGKVFLLVPYENLLLVCRPSQHMDRRKPCAAPVHFPTTTALLLQMKEGVVVVWNHKLPQQQHHEKELKKKKKLIIH